MNRYHRSARIGTVSPILSYDELYREKEHVYRILGYYGSDELLEEKKALTKGIEGAFMNAAENTKDVMTRLLDHISDNRIEHI